ncbi:hypothetical protein CTAYLR_003693 [Chrysophaeum taylorii]|uniref:Uncharacterized protein n=1 Tax=Chrysophaeum taylorii TaxID=2483200 RepID=A0AAD7XPS4_9STRA|nr:hypothetical protein CTAYLR_003693 [Chrysophaeum taylorii]
MIGRGPRPVTALSQVVAFDVSHDEQSTSSNTSEPNETPEVAAPVQTGPSPSRPASVVPRRARANQDRERTNKIIALAASKASLAAAKLRLQLLEAEARKKREKVDPPKISTEATVATAEAAAAAAAADSAPAAAIATEASVEPIKALSSWCQNFVETAVERAARAKEARAEVLAPMQDFVLEQFRDSQSANTDWDTESADSVESRKREMPPKQTPPKPPKRLRVVRYFGDGETLPDEPAAPAPAPPPRAPAPAQAVAPPLVPQPQPTMRRATSTDARSTVRNERGGYNQVAAVLESAKVDSKARRTQVQHQEHATRLANATQDIESRLMNMRAQIAEREQEKLTTYEIDSETHAQMIAEPVRHREHARLATTRDVEARMMNLRPQMMERRANVAPATQFQSRQNGNARIRDTYEFYEPQYDDDGDAAIGRLLSIRLELAAAASALETHESHMRRAQRTTHDSVSLVFVNKRSQMGRVSTMGTRSRARFDAVIADLADSFLR